MCDPCETCPSPFGSYQCLDCRFNEDNWKMPDSEQEQARREYWKHIARINNEPLDPDYVEVLRTTNYEVDSTAGLVFSEVVSDCFAVVDALRKYHFIIRDAAGVTSQTIHELREQLTGIFVNAGFLYYEKVPVVVTDDDLPF